MDQQHSHRRHQRRSMNDRLAGDIAIGIIAGAGTNGLGESRRRYARLGDGMCPAYSVLSLP